MSSFTALLEEVRGCTICREHLPFAPRPIFQLHPQARIVIIGQAPGKKVHVSGVPFADASGERLREWLGMKRDIFYDPCKVAILPMGFCYPGAGSSGDRPPRPECAEKWHDVLLCQLAHRQITLVLGRYAQKYHFETKASLTDLVRSWHRYWPQSVPLPHPSPRNNFWFRRNPWFEQEVLPPLRGRIAEILS